MYLDFNKISEEIRFEDLLKHLKIDYEQKGGNLVGEFEDGQKFSVSIEKNLFFCPTNKELKGSVINFFSVVKRVGLRRSAESLVRIFTKPEVKLPDLELHYHPELRKRGFHEPDVQDVGLVKTRSVLAGSIAFTVYEDEEIVGYIGYKNGEWLIPKSLKGKKGEVKINSAFLSFLND